MGWRRGQAYSQDLRDRVLSEEGSARAVAAQFLVSVSYVVKARQRRDRKGEVTPGPQHSHTPRKLAALHEAIAVYAAEHTDATINEFRAWLQDEHGSYASAGLMWNTLDRLGLTLKKDLSCRRAGAFRGCRSTPEVAGAASRAEPREAGLPR
jgi:transposase